MANTVTNANGIIAQAAQAQAALAAEAQAAAAAGQTLNALGLGGNDTAPQIDPNLLNAANQVMGQ